MNSEYVKRDIEYLTISLTESWLDLFKRPYIATGKLAFFENPEFPFQLSNCFSQFYRIVLFIHITHPITHSPQVLYNVTVANYNHFSKNMLTG